jgi:cytochrome c-type biogenesis protein CcmH
MRGLVTAAALLVAAMSPAAAQQAVPVGDEVVHEVAVRLRCVVCQNLSVADSPSEMAGQMRTIIRERLAAGESPQDVQRYFVERYGEWILLAPTSPAAWILPFIVLVLGVAALAIWLMRRPAPTAAVRASVDDETRRRLHDEAEALDA